MGGLSFARCFRLRPGAIECDADGLRVGGVALLARDAKGAWTRRDGGELSRELSKLYGLPLDCERKGGALDAVAAALTNRELARAQIGALLLRLPDPPRPRASTPTAWKSAVSPRASGLQPPESGRRLGRKAPENRRAAESRLVRSTRGRRPRTRRSQTPTLRRPAPRAAARRWPSSPLRRRPASIRCSPKTCRRPPCAGWRRWPLASPPRRSCSTRSSCRATTASSRRAAFPAVPTSPIAGRTTKPKLR